ncbi:hypothetical protein GN958_ATG14140 [Phytophthora infestans]|uniref:Uncharacterized protein n=1 Tax=Phytophthora infestans TaxID=4787 RepID=A0A8S9U820_PHYIN|nr:hypothetical protein GN958_ATG14140 [Phytophthora infestans]
MVRVVSCHFLRLSCSEDDHPLFRRYYARCNRERGVKLLRCFPHCCPEHVQRCYCGTSIHVQVSFTTILPPVVREKLLVCARFEPSRVVPLWPNNAASAPGYDAMQEDERKLQPGEVVALPASLLAVEKRKPDQTVWIRADREGELKQKTLPQNAVLYVLNNHRFPKWQYSYDSSVTRAQREMSHHLVVYVFQLTGSRLDSGEIEAAILARHESPGFYLVSYRRSGINGRDTGCELPALDTASNTKFAAVEVDLSTFTSTSDAVQVRFVGPSVSAGNISNLETKIAAYPSIITTTGCSIAPQSAAGDSDAAFWASDVRVYRSGLAEKAKHLLILWRFLSFVTLEDAGITLDILRTQIRSHWLHAARVLQTSSRTPSWRRLSQLECVIGSLLLSLCRGTSLFSPHQTATHEQIVVQATAHLLLRALSSRAVQYALQTAFTLGTGGMDKRHIRERFIVLVSDLYDILGDLCRLGSSDVASVLPRDRISVPAIVDEVVSLIYTQRQFTELRNEISGMLRGQLTSHSGLLDSNLESLFGYFTAQTNEVLFATQSGPAALIHLRGAENAWTRTWLLEPGSIQVTRIPTLFVEPSLVSFTRWVHEFACIEVALNESESRLSVSSLLPMIKRVAPTEFQLDGRLRSFRSTPSGISTMLPMEGGWWIGDYVGSFSAQTNTLLLDLYATRDSAENGSIDASTTVRRVSISFVLEEYLNAANFPSSVCSRDRCIVFNGVVAQATYEQNYPTSSSQPKLGDASTVIQAMILQRMQWTAQLEVQGGYVAVPS